MPNHITNKIIVDSIYCHCVDIVSPSGELDFRLLIPQPPHIYLSSTTSKDEEEFPCNWHSWNQENWGTKWNAYQCSVTHDNLHSSLQFDTAWRPPFPIMSAFANRFRIPFIHCYMDEGGGHWGIDQWIVEDKGIMRRFKAERTSERYIQLGEELGIPLQSDR
jgi:hypothetical protein